MSRICQILVVSSLLIQAPVSSHAKSNTQNFNRELPNPVEDFLKTGTLAEFQKIYAQDKYFALIALSQLVTNKGEIIFFDKDTNSNVTITSVADRKRILDQYYPSLSKSDKQLVDMWAFTDSLISEDPELIKERFEARSITDPKLRFDELCSAATYLIQRSYRNLGNGVVDLNSSGEALAPIVPLLSSFNELPKNSCKYWEKDGTGRSFTFSLDGVKAAAEPYYKANIANKKYAVLSPPQQIVTPNIRKESHCTLPAIARAVKLEALKLEEQRDTPSIDHLMMFDENDCTVTGLLTKRKGGYVYTMRFIKPEPHQDVLKFKKPEDLDKYINQEPPKTVARQEPKPAPSSVDQTKIINAGMGNAIMNPLGNAFGLGGARAAQ